MKNAFTFRYMRELEHKLSRHYRKCMRLITKEMPLSKRNAISLTLPHILLLSTVYMVKVNLNGNSDMVIGYIYLIPYVTIKRTIKLNDR